MSTEDSMLERVGNLMEPAAPEPPPKEPATPPADPDEVEIEELASEQDPDEPAPEEPAFDGLELEVAGETKKLTKAELKAALEEHGTLKQTAAALQEQRVALEAERVAAQQVVQLAPAVEAIRAEGRMLKQIMDGLYQEVQALTESDPIAAFQKQQQLTNLQGRFNQLAQQDAQVSGQLQNWQVQQMQAQLAAEGPRLLEKLPQWKNPDKRKSDQTFIREYMKREGFSDDEANLVTRSHYVSTLLKAAKYDAITAARASKKVTNAPVMARPGTVATPGLTKALAKSEYRKAVAGAKTDSDKAKIIQRELERRL